ncbi:MAG: Ig-like domain-containing protein [Oscillospiraceae bacterium]
MRKSFFRSFLNTLLALMMIVTVAAVPSSAASVKLSKSSISLTKGYSTTLSVSGTTSKVTWSTGNKNIATVSSKGKVVGKKVGSTYIYARVNSTTLKCKVNVVAGKISVGSSEVELDPGKSVKVRIKALGSHSLSVSTSNQKVVKATWSGAKFNGNYIDLTLKAVNPGSARVKVYLKNYKNIYKYIDVDVIGDESDDIIEDPDSGLTTGKAQIQSSVSSVSVAEGSSQSFTIYASSASLLSSLKVSSSSIFGFSVKTSVDNTKNAIVVTVQGYSAETGSIKVFSTTDSSISVTIPVTVTSAAQYYKLLDTKPTAKLLQTDIIIAFQSGTTAYYMLVPYGYDPAYANTVAAKSLNFYSYNQVYESIPQKKLSTDQIITKNVVFNGTLQARYVLAPYGYDSAFVDTIFAKYSGSYEYYVVYTESPTNKKNWSDEVLTWTISKTNAATGKIEAQSRYMLVPLGYDVDKVNEIKNKDTNTNVSVQPYTVYSTLPIIDSKVYKVIQWTKGTNENRYMVVPISNCDYVKRNDIVRKDVGYFSYYVAYSERPTVGTSDNQAVYSLTLQESDGTLREIYILYNPKDSDYQTKINAAINSNSAYIGVRQGSLS